MKVTGFTGAGLVGTMITNHELGHSPATHAAATAAKIVIDPLLQNDSTGAKRAAAEVLRENTSAFLAEYHEHIDKYYKTLLESDLDKLVESSLRSFLELTKGTILEFHYSNPQVQDLIRFELRHEFGSQLEFLRANKP